MENLIIAKKGEIDISRVPEGPEGAAQALLEISNRIESGEHYSGWDNDDVEYYANSHRKTAENILAGKAGSEQSWFDQLVAMAANDLVS